MLIKHIYISVSVAEPMQEGVMREPIRGSLIEFVDEVDKLKPH